MKYSILFSIFIITTSSVSSQIARCDFEYLYVGPYIYGCGLTLYNPLFLEVNELEGEHTNQDDELLTDSDVIGLVHYNGSIGFFPNVICKRLSKLQKIDLFDSGLRAILSDSFSDCNELKWLKLMNNQINSISFDAFVMSFKLEYLDLTNSSLKTLPDGIFDSLLSLETLILQDNILEGLNDIIFKNLMKLSTLNLQNTNLSMINPIWFQSNINLADLNLSFNQITKISREILSTITKVNFLNLSNNKIQSFDSDTLNDLSNLIWLDLSHNQIKILADNSFINKPELQILDLNYNKIDDLSLGIFAPISSLRHLAMNGNGLKVFRRSIFGDSMLNMTVIDLHENKINAMDRKVIEDSPEMDYFGFLDNVCQTGSMYEFKNMRSIYLGLLENCFDNFKWTVETHTAHSPVYTFYQLKDNGIEIHVQSQATVQIALTPFAFPYIPMIEVIIGTSQNGQSIIKRNQKTKDVEVLTPNVIDKNGSNIFKITWNDYQIEVFKGDDEEAFMSYTMIDKFNIRYYGIETPESEGDWGIEPIWTQE